MLEKRAEKASRYVFSICYFTWATAYGYYTLADAPFLPWWLGGRGTWEALWTDAPYGDQHPGLLTYALLQLGYHFGDLLYHQFAAKRGSDYTEMLTHHICTSALLFTMIFSNYLRIGCLISFQHDIADIPCSLTKYFVQTKYTTATLISFATNMVVWGYTRNLLLPYVVWRIVGENLWMVAPFEEYWVIAALTCVFLSVMAALHYYWYYLFLCMLTKYQQKGEATDIHDEKKSQKSH